MLKKLIALILVLSVWQVYSNVLKPMSEEVEYERAVQFHKTGESQLAFQIFEQLAKKDYVPAQYALGRMYSSGDGIPRDMDKAFHWISSAAYYGLAEAQNTLGLMYDEGWGVRKNDETAAHWYFQAANQGLTKAQVNIGIMFCTGEGARKDMVQCVRWMKIAIAKGSKRAEDAWVVYNLDEFQQKKDLAVSRKVIK